MMGFNDYRRLSQATRRIFALSLSTTDRVAYTCPQGKSCRIDAIVAVNTHSGSVSYNLHHCGPGESSATTNALYYEQSLSSKTTSIDDTPKYLTSGESIVLKASSASHITVTAYGTETHTRTEPGA